MCFLNFKNCLILNPLFMNVNLDRHIFELCQRDQQRVILKCETMQEKNDWMAALVMLNTKSMLERTLDVILSDEENKHPLHLPDSKLYKYYYYCCYSFIPVTFLILHSDRIWGPGGQNSINLVRMEHPLE